MQTCTVRYPLSTTIVLSWPLFIGTVGLVMTALGKGHWTYGAAAIWCLLGCLSIFYSRNYQTEFRADGIEQTRFMRQPSWHLYSEIERVGVGAGKSAHALTIYLAGGRKMMVFGEEKQLIKAGCFLARKRPDLVRPTPEV